MNLSSTLEPPQEGEFIDAIATPGGIPLFHRVIIAAILIVASVVGTVGNSLVVLSVVISKKLRTATNVFVVNLAVADVLTALFLPFSAVALVIDAEPAIPNWLCGSSVGVIYICLACSLYTLASIGVNRLLLITRPTHVCKKLFQPRVLGVWVTCIWVYSIGIIVLPVTFDQGQLGYDTPYHTCGGMNEHPNAAVFESFLVLGLYPVPLLVMIATYVILYAHIRLHGRRMMMGRGDPSEMSSTNTTKSNNTDKSRRMVTPVPSEAPTSPAVIASPLAVTSPIFQTFDTEDTPPRSRENTPNITPDVTPRPLRRQLTTACESCTPTLGQMRRTRRKKISKRHLQITKNLFYVVLAFLVCLTPYFMVFIFGLTDAAVLYAAAAIFFNSCVNPFVYATKHPHFKKVFKCILLCKIKSVPEPASFLKSIESVVNKG